jgi:hypothetical protein
MRGVSPVRLGCQPQMRHSAADAAGSVASREKSLVIKVLTAQKILCARKLCYYTILLMHNNMSGFFMNFSCACTPANDENSDLLQTKKLQHEK